MSEPPAALASELDGDVRGFAARVLEGAADARPEATALRSGNTVLTFGELDRLVASIAGRLLATGLRVGERVAISGVTAAEFLPSFLAVLAVGAVAVPISSVLGAKRMARQLRAAAPALHLAAPNEAPPATGIPLIRVSVDRTGARFSPDPGAQRVGLRFRDHADASALILFTSGTTGRPKGVVLSHRNLSWNAQTLSQVFALGPNHNDLVLSSLAHSGALQRALATLFSGGTVVLLNGRLSVAQLLEQSRAESIHGFYTPPSLVHFLLGTSAERVKEGLDTCRSIEIGSAGIASGELAQVLELLPQARLFVHYGLTECSRSTILDCRAHADKLETVGRAARGTELEIRSPDGKQVETGRKGQIALRGPQMAADHWGKRSQAHEGTSWSDGWLLTGDYGRVDADGFLTFLGREDDRVNSSGFSFFPAEIEHELGNVAGVEQYLIVGIPDPMGLAGEVTCALVVPSEPETWSAASFRLFARENLPSHLVPRRIVPVPALVLTPLGKPDRRGTLRRFAPELLAR